MGDRPSFPAVLRAAELLFSIIAFSVVVVYSGSSKINYIIFTGCAGLVTAFAMLVLHAAGNKAARGKPSVVIDGLMWVFWLTAAAIATNLLTDGFTASRIQASCAFCWITWVCWSLSLVISIREAKGYEY